MPTKSKAQHNLMAAVAHSKEWSEKTGIPQSVAREFLEADERKAAKKKKENTGD